MLFVLLLMFVFFISQLQSSCSPDRHKRSFPNEGKQPQDDNTNPDEPNPKILVRVPRRQKRHGSHGSRGARKRGPGRVVHGRKAKMMKYKKKGESAAARQLRKIRYESPPLPSLYPRPFFLFFIWSAAFIQIIILKINVLPDTKLFSATVWALFCCTLYPTNQHW